MIDKIKLEELLEKIRIDTHYYDDMIVRDFADVVEDLAKSWGALNDDYKDELYEAMGIMPSKPKTPYINYPSGVRTIPLGGDTGIEYIKNQPTTCGLNEIKEIYKDTLEMTHDADSKQDLIRFNAKAIVDDIYYENAKFEICCDGGIVLENYKEM